MPLPPLISVAEANQAEKIPEVVILFSDQDMETNPYGFMALSWPVMIPFHDKMYKSARHAIFAEMAREFGEEERAAAIEATESGTDIHYTIDDVVGGRDSQQNKWNTTLSRLIDVINLEKFKRYQELALRLMETPSMSVIGAYESNDIQMGIGLSVDNVKAKNKLEWTGQNLIGKALMKIRQNLLTERAQAAQSMTKPKRAKPKSSVSMKSKEAVSSAPVEEVMKASSTSGITTPEATAAGPSVLKPRSIRTGPRVPPTATLVQSSETSNRLPNNDEKYPI
jgi:predicted NAD-dependent protein-ADP-ribosyltransferase YbiA (DUF1768 family)